jgi:hypothetical protein
MYSIGMGRSGEAGKLGGLIEEAVLAADQALSALRPFSEHGGQTL